MKVIVLAVLLIFQEVITLAQCEPAKDFFSLKDTAFKINSVYRTWDIHWQYDKTGPDLSDSLTLKTLYAIAHFIRKNKNVVVEISVYLDCRGASEYNLKLSEMRARSLWTFFYDKEVNPIRMTHKGYGENCPLLPCDKILTLPQEEQALQEEKNRRVEIKILRTDHRQ